MNALKTGFVSAAAVVAAFLMTRSICRRTDDSGSAARVSIGEAEGRLRSLSARPPSADESPNRLNERLDQFSGIIAIRDLNDRTRALNRFLEKLSADEFPAVFERLTDLGQVDPSRNPRQGHGSTSAEGRLILAAWSRLDGQAAAEYCAAELSMTEGYPSTSACAVVMNGWVAADPAAAIRWAGDFMTRREGVDASGMPLQQAFESLAVSDPALAEKFSLETTDPEKRSQAIRGVAMIKSRNGDAALKEWAEGLPDQEARNAAASVAVLMYGSWDRGGTLNWLADRGMVPGEKEAGLMIRSWAEADRKGVEAYLAGMAEGALREQVRHALEGR